jgi:hypothetical protein
MTITVNLISPPDREKLVAEIICDHEQWAEVHQENKELTLKVYPRQDGQPWKLSYEEALTALQTAKIRLIGGSK